MFFRAPKIAPRPVGVLFLKISQFEFLEFQTFLRNASFEIEFSKYDSVV